MIQNNTNEKINCVIVGTGKIGIDLYIKCQKSNRATILFLVLRNKLLRKILMYLLKCHQLLTSIQDKTSS